MSILQWQMNKLEEEIPGNDAYVTNAFLAGHNAPLTVTSVPGLAHTQENVTVKDNGFGMPFTLHHFNFAYSNPALLAGAWKSVSANITAVLTAAPGIDNYNELSTHESYRSTHGNSLADKIAYLNYVYNLPPGTSHDNILQQLQAATVQSAVYTVGGNTVRNVSYRQAIGGDPNMPSGTLLLSAHNPGTVTTAGFTFLGSVLEKSKRKYANTFFPPLPPPPAVGADNPFLYAAPGLPPGPPNPALGGISFGSASYEITGVSRIANNSYAYMLKAAGNRNYNVYMRLPEYISRTRALLYNLISIEPYTFDNSKRYFKALLTAFARRAPTFF